MKKIALVLVCPFVFTGALAQNEERVEAVELILKNAHENVQLYRAEETGAPDTEEYRQVWERIDRQCSINQCVVFPTIE